MTVLVVGASHRSAPVEVLEQLALDPDAAAKLRTAALETDHVIEAVVLATCNRVEIYAAVDRFHGSVDDLTALLVERTDLSADVLTPSLYVHYDEAAVAHLFSVATGLDSMVVGESQILGQVRAALRHSQDTESLGTSLNALFQQGLRVGKRAHAETGIDRAGQSLVSVALAEAAEIVGPLEGLRVCIVGAGSIAALAATSARRADVGDIVVVSRTLSNAQRLAVAVGGRAVDIDTLSAELATVDLVVSCTGATGTVITAGMFTHVGTERSSAAPLVVADLALPRDVDQAVGQLPHVVVIGLESLATSLHNGAALEDVAAVRTIVAEEVAAFVAARDAARVAPTLVALRTMATGVVAVELERLWTRLDTLTPQERHEVERTVRRVADKLLHEPSVRIKEYAGRSLESSYADALAELFALHPSAVEAVTKPGDLS
ncbi:MAG: glutamyl-tRNA reductase [Nocardioidaceae bacterium]